MVFGEAWVYDKARIGDEARVFGKAFVTGTTTEVVKVWRLQGWGLLSEKYFKEGVDRMEMMEARNMTKDLKVSESYIVGIDISENKDLSVMMFSRFKKGKMSIVKVFHSTEAEEMYEHLTGQKVGVIRDG